MFSKIKYRLFAIFCICFFILLIIVVIFAAVALYKSDVRNYDEYIVKANRVGSTLYIKSFVDYDSAVTKRIVSFILRYLVILVFTIVTVGYLVFNYLYKKFIISEQNNNKIVEFKEQAEALDIISKEEIIENDDYQKISLFISHELKNKLAILKAKTDLQDFNNFKKYIKDMENEIEDINSLMTTDPYVIPTDLLLLAAEVTDEIQNGTVKLDFDDDCNGFVILGNPTLLKRAIYNILENAYKYGAKDVSISLKHIKNNIVLEIKNNGDKIKRENIDHIFDFKYRAERLKTNGSGIGLALVQKVVDLHNGSIYVESDETTKFILSFAAFTPEGKDV